MGKKKGGKRFSKREIADALQALFQAHPSEALTFKQIFKALRLDTHPAKMLAIDTMEEMAWDDYLSKVDNNMDEIVGQEGREFFAVDIPELI